MPLLRINAINGKPRLHDGEGCVNLALYEQLAALPPGAPVIVLIHGYKYSPQTSYTDPHRHILSLRPPKGCWKALSWPRHLGFGRGNSEEGLCIAFGWEARGSIWQAWHNAQTSGDALAGLLRIIQSHRRMRVDIVAHSLGVRVAIAAISKVPAGSIGRAVFMAAAEFQGAATAALSSPAGQTAEFINITSRENDFFDACIEWFLQAPNRSDRALGLGLWQRTSNWLDIQVDAPKVRRVLADFGYIIPPPRASICHWWAYLRPGLLTFYRDLIRKPDCLPLVDLRRALPNKPSPRWSRLGALVRSYFVFRRKVTH